MNVYWYEENQVLVAEVKRLWLMNAELVKTLEWYADKGNYETGQDWPDILIDNGAGARAAIAKAKGEA